MSWALTVRMCSLFLSKTFQEVLLWTFSKNPSDPPSARGFFSLTFWGMSHFAAYSREDVHAASAGTVCIAQMGPAFVPVLSA